MASTQYIPTSPERRLAPEADGERSDSRSGLANPRLRRVLVPAAIFGLGLLGAAVLLQGPPEVSVVPTPPEPPEIRVWIAQVETLQLSVPSQGTVVPRTESELVAQVPGQVVSIAPGLEEGAFFQRGDQLARLDPSDLELAVERAQAALQRALVEAEFAKATLTRQLALLERGIANMAMIDEKRRAAGIAEARKREAAVDLAQAQQNLERTRIIAPFDGRTRSRSIDIGSYASVGTPLARLYAVDYAEVRLPVADAELPFVNLTLGQSVNPETAPVVELRARFAGDIHQWTGRIVRTEAAIDPRTRMVNVVVRVPRPYEQNEARPPLAAGLFVEAEILGRRVDDVVRIPRAALADANSVWVIDDEDQLRRREVSVLRLERDSALLSGGLEASDRVSLLEPRLARAGLQVRPVEAINIADREPRPEPRPEPTS